MPSTASPLLQFEEQAPGENNNTWGTKANAAMQRLEEAIAGVTSVTLSADTTLDDTTFTANQSRSMILNVTGAGGFNIIIPNRSKLYLVRNAASSTAGIKTSSGSAVTVAAGDSQWVWCDGSNTVRAVNIPASTLATVMLKANNLSDVASASTARTNLGLGSIATFPETTAAQFQANTAGKALSTDKVWSAADYVALADAATIAVDMSALVNASVTLAGNRTLGNPTNTKNGQSGILVINQDGTGSRTLAYGANWKFASGAAPTLTTTAGARDILAYQVISSTAILAQLIKDVK